MQLIYMPRGIVKRVLSASLF